MKPVTLIFLHGHRRSSAKDAQSLADFAATSPSFTVSANHSRWNTNSYRRRCISQIPEAPPREPTKPPSRGGLSFCDVSITLSACHPT